jgi:hypothetical protein
VADFACKGNIIENRMGMAPVEQLAPDPAAYGHDKEAV